jgi:CheY-like chemotaxis protein
MRAALGRRNMAGAGNRQPWLGVSSRISLSAWGPARDNGSFNMSKPKRILLVEDNPKDVELSLAVFEEFNLATEVVVTRNGAHALDYLFRRGEFADRAEGNPAVILLDLKMPKVNGLEVLAQVKADEQLRMVPVVMLTSSREEKDLLASYKRGVNAYLVKPIDFQQFVETVRQLGIFWAVLNEPPPGTSAGAPTVRLKRTGA